MTKAPRLPCQAPSDAALPRPWFKREWGKVPLPHSYGVQGVPAGGYPGNQGCRRETQPGQAQPQGAARGGVDGVPGPPLLAGGVSNKGLGSAAEPAWEPDPAPRRCCPLQPPNSHCRGGPHGLQRWGCGGEQPLGRGRKGAGKTPRHRDGRSGTRGWSPSRHREVVQEPSLPGSGCCCVGQGAGRQLWR